MTAVRWLFVVAVVAVATWGLRDRADELGDVLLATSPAGLSLAAASVVVGLMLTSVVWLRLVAGFGRPLPSAEGRRVFFVGQLGKYLPGGVWSVGAQADLARAHVPPRTTVAAGLVFLAANVVTATGVAAVVVLSPWLAAAVLVVAVLALTPRALGALGGRLAGGDRLRLSAGTTVQLALLLLVTWTCYGVAVTVLAVEPSLRLLAVSTGAFAAAYVVGVVVVVAPAGLGAREVVLVALLAPTTGLAAATALALLTRLLHTMGDFGLALAASLAGGRWASRAGRPDRMRA